MSWTAHIRAWWWACALSPLKGLQGSHLAGSQELHPPGHLETVADKVFHGQRAQPQVFDCIEEQGALKRGPPP